MLVLAAAVATRIGSTLSRCCMFFTVSYYKNSVVPVYCAVFLGHWSRGFVPLYVAPFCLEQYTDNII